MSLEAALLSNLGLEDQIHMGAGSEQEISAKKRVLEAGAEVGAGLLPEPALCAATRTLTISRDKGVTPLHRIQAIEDWTETHVQSMCRSLVRLGKSCFAVQLALVRCCTL